MAPWAGAFLEVLIDAFTVPLLILLVSIFRKEPRQRRLDLTTVIGYVVYVAVGAEIMPRGMMRNYDALFLRADARLGFDPIAFADAISGHWAIMIVLLLAYGALPIMIGLTWVLEQDLAMRRAVLLGGCLCFGFYALFPAEGPGHFDWIHHVNLPGPDNCMPSMHLTWALLIALNARSIRLRIGLWVYVVLIAAATLALREHYLVDLLAAVPYTCGIQWMARRSGRLVLVFEGKWNSPPAGPLDRNESQS